MKAIDSNLLVYASLSDHPAVDACEEHIAAHPTWVCNIANLIEMRHVLVSVYGLAEHDADAKFADFRAAVIVAALTPSLAEAAVVLRREHGVDFNDAVLMETCRQRGVTALATDDRQLAAACRSFGITPESPIDDGLRAQMRDWEDRNLPAKGLPRVLLQCHRWIGRRDSDLAAEFYTATQALSRLV